MSHRAHKDLGLRGHFVNGHRVHDKTPAELKSDLIYDQSPTRD